MADYRKIPEKALELLSNGVKMGSTGNKFSLNTGEALHTIRNRTPWRNKGLKYVKYFVPLKFNRCHFKNCVLLSMQPGSFQVKGYANRRFFRHASFLTSLGFFIQLSLY